MALTVYNAPASIEQRPFNSKTWEADTQWYMDELRAFVRRCKVKPCPEQGKIVKFPHADSYAQYMVISMSPVQLVHIPLMDGWEYPYIERLTAKDIREKVKHEQMIQERYFKIKNNQNPTL